MVSLSPLPKCRLSTCQNVGFYAIKYIDRASVALSAARAVSGDERVEYDEEVDLGVYDRALRLLEGGGGRAADELGA